ncbi:syg-2 [Pristionchus pacificus]|uniref:Syg-2 n=1 Tax=Pristionchus pacificus TaxID=54126 RepID=A0A2A6CU77_PRIPA|nr:syg-2 [Pristionchus pacificus]|eukprot:PDM81607.1 syg-2 [Pristionchus pacificus]
MHCLACFTPIHHPIRPVQSFPLEDPKEKMRNSRSSSTILLLLFLLPLIYAGFHEIPLNQSVLIGEDVLFKCSAQKNPNNYELWSQWAINTGALLGFHDSGKLAGHQGRYSYVKESPEELHLKIERVSLEDDGRFECQMLRPGDGPFRAAALLNVIVPPTTVHFVNYQRGGVIEVNEDSQLNITCTSPNAKPAPKLLWYINGQRIDDDVERFDSYNLNKTSTAYASLVWKPRKEDDGKVLTCEAQHSSRTEAPPLRANISLSVLYSSDRPEVSVLGGETNVRAGDNVTLICVAKGGNPAPSLTWHIKDKNIDSRYHLDASSQETRNVYSFIAEATDHLASYECRSKNREGIPAVTNHINIRVAFAPAAVEIFGEHSIKEGAITSIQCRSKPSNPPSRMSWLVNGHPVPASVQSEHQQINGVVSISNLSLNSNEVRVHIVSEVLNSKHKIVIECVAKNEEGSTSGQHVIKILSPPMPPRITGLEDALHAEGERINLTCEAHGGNPLADITWYRGFDKRFKKKAKWHIIPGARSSVSGDSVISTVTLNLDRAMNNQRIKCEAMNTALDEPLHDSKQLSVLYPPRRVSIRTPEGSQRQQLISGKESQLLCSAPGSNPPAELHWEFQPNGESMPIVLRGETTMNETTRENGFTVENIISFIPTDKYDGTLVRCIASHPLWTITRNVTLPLNVYYSPRLLVDSPISIVIAEGDSFKENLTILANPPVSAWRWRKNGIPFDQTVGGIFTSRSMLSGRQIKETDAGIYSLFAVNNVGSVNVTFQLTVEYAAKVLQITSPVIADQGQEVVLECEVEGVPKKPNMVKWMRKGYEIASEVRGDTKAILRITASSENTGKYTCINHMPSLARGAGPLGGKARLRCRVHSVPDAEFAWYRGTELIKGNTSKFSMASHQLDYSTFESTLWVHNLGPDDYSRDVKCTAFNRMGEDHIVIPVGPLAPPETPLHLHSTNSTRETIALSWTPGFDGGADQTFEVRYKREGEDAMYAVNTTHSHVRLAGLIPASSYIFQVRSHNARGFSSDFTRPSQMFSTLTEDGVDMTAISSSKSSLLNPRTLTFIVAAIAFLIFINFCLLCCYQKRQRRKKIQEKTEIIRSSQNGADGVRPVQMYGAMGVLDGRPSSGQTTIKEDHAGSDDDRSVRTMIEVNPNGYMQQIDPAFYERNCLVDYEFDPRGYSSRDGTLRGTYSNVPYPEPPRETSSIYTGSLNRRFSNNNTLSNQGTPQHMLSTFIQPTGVRTGPIRYSQLDGDLV